MCSAQAQVWLSRLGVMYRDSSLSRRSLEMYHVGTLFRERAFVEGTYKFGGLAAPHRYVIFAGHAIRLDSFGPHPEWGLCVCQDRSIFKVISIVESRGRSQVALLQVPEALRGVSHPGTESGRRGVCSSSGKLARSGARTRTTRRAPDRRLVEAGQLSPGISRRWRLVRILASQHVTEKTAARRQTIHAILRDPPSLAPTATRRHFSSR